MVKYIQENKSNSQPLPIFGYVLRIYFHFILKVDFLEK